MQFPLILARDLPISTSDLSPQDTLLVIRGNDKLERVSYDAIKNVSPSYIKDCPTTPTDDGEESNIAWNENGVYTFSNGLWGKTPRLLTSWEDLDSESRFLLVNKSVELSPKEIYNARTSLNISHATTTNEGLVKLAESISANDGGVITGPQLIDYIETQLSNIQPTTPTNVDLGNYSGDVLLKGKNGEVLLMYDSGTNTLYIGSANVNVVVQSKDKTLVQNNNAETIATLE